MASINQLVSELSHTVQGADNVAIRRAMRLAIVHARNKLIRQSYENHKSVDKVLTQRYKVAVDIVPDGDIATDGAYTTDVVLRTIDKVNVPTRFSNGIPFLTVKTVGNVNPVIIPFIREGHYQFYNNLPGFCINIGYDYINRYIYIFVPKNSNLQNIKYITIESVFEEPAQIPIETNEGIYNYNDNDEYFLPEDMIDDLKVIVLNSFNVQIIRDTNEVRDETLTV
jgi:hypothetical protein